MRPAHEKVSVAATQTPAIFARPRLQDKQKPVAVAEESVARRLVRARRRHAGPVRGVEAKEGARACFCWKGFDEHKASGVGVPSLQPVVLRPAEQSSEAASIKRGTVSKIRSLTRSVPQRTHILSFSLPPPPSHTHTPPPMNRGTKDQLGVTQALPRRQPRPHLYGFCRHRCDHRCIWLNECYDMAVATPTPIWLPPSPRWRVPSPLYKAKRLLAHLAM